MTTYSQMNNVGYTSFNRADSPPRQRRRPDIAGQFVNAGFEMLDHSQFMFQAGNATFYVVPSHQGLKVTGELLDEPLIFTYGTSPDAIADKLLDLADPDRWLTENLPETEDHPLADEPPYCYGINRNEIA